MGFIVESCRSQGIDVSLIDALPIKASPRDVAMLVRDIKPDIVCYVVYGQNPNASSVMYGVISYSEEVCRSILMC